MLAGFSYLNESKNIEGWFSMVFYGKTWTLISDIKPEIPDYRKMQQIFKKTKFQECAEIISKYILRTLGLLKLPNDLQRYFISPQ